MLLGNSRIACVSKMASLSLTEIRHIFWAFFFPQKKAFCFELERKAHGIVFSIVHRIH